MPLLGFLRIIVADPDRVTQRRTIAIFIWGDLFEDFFDTIGVSLENFCSDLRGGWLGGLVHALRTADVRTVIILFSGRVADALRVTDKDTDTQICVLPNSNLHKLCRKLMSKPYSFNVRKMFDSERGFRRVMGKLLWHVSPYLVMPLGAVARELRRSRAEALLCQEYESARFDLCVLLGGLLRLPVFATFQGGTQQLTFFERFFRRFTIKSCAGLIIASRKEQQRVVLTYGLDRSKLRGIINPLDLHMWRPMNRAAARSRLSIAIDDQVVVWHGRLDIQSKGLDVLISAWKKICDRHPRRALRLVLVGSGWGASWLKRTIHDNHLMNVHWSGDYVQDIELIRCYLSAADIYVLPSRIEGFAVAPMEAMAIGLPVVMSDVSGAAELLPAGADSGGFIVPIADPESLADAVCRLLDAPELRREMGKSARRRVEECASLESVGRQLKEFIFGTRKSRSSLEAASQ